MILPLHHFRVLASHHSVVQCVFLPLGSTRRESRPSFLPFGALPVCLPSAGRHAYEADDRASGGGQTRPDKAPSTQHLLMMPDATTAAGVREQSIPPPRHSGMTDVEDPQRRNKQN